MGDSDSELERVCAPDPQMNLGLWILFHADLKRTARVLALRDFMVDEMKLKKDLFEGNIAC